MKTLLLILVSAVAIASAADSFDWDGLSAFRQKLRGKAENCPNRPDLPPFQMPLPSSVVTDIVQLLEDNTLAPCTAEAHSPSSTAISGGVILQGTRTYFNSGCASKKAPSTPPTSDTIYRIASVTKTFACETVLKALKDGLIRSIDDEVRRYVPEFSIINPSLEQPTFRQMMSQLSGLPRSAPCLGDCNETTATMLQRIRYLAVEFPLNQEPSYSNLAYSLLGNLIAERLYKTNWLTFLKVNITGPLGMSSTGGEFSPDVLARMATEYKTDGSVPPLAVLGWRTPGGGLYSTAKDVGTWVEYLLSDWWKCPQRRHMMQNIHWNADMSTGWSAPWELISSSGFTVRTKYGAIDGVSAVMAMVPELDFGFWILWNGEGIDSNDLAKQISDIAIPPIVDMFAAQQVASWPSPTPEFGSIYIGDYKAEGPVLASIYALVNGSHAVLKLKITDPLGFVLDLYLKPSADKQKYQMWADRSKFPCDATQGGIDLAWVDFSRSPTDNKARFIAPGILWGYFNKS